uniref:Uncharacterized protein n=1 Tax=Calcidiscus leptoporus TaxID=127549 RepID=A0A7S0JH44_9EUKA|mmetsp:Transcript_58554/g.134349  ORF Transcript_58554/g.134349 Transcript_58554/m.134349 type:complete len:132 (+) Transcript_58554:47-442(+)|eukprot:CAMPEP_0119377742 /NCGR_PEP_ID=MMETSP1334-20130426/46439_1 /TAXON_ID=127549 /ORGANISM="Calcidiscus leptoporus, Strain RCC1130" /LENGTH=131 /DNA_ID=CAMNT_0007396755 /DNA_START=47 /DNA_END=442 /DNA_ORIENTATION=-
MRVMLALCAVCGIVALDVKWTPNGEAPAPFSKKAREQMGIDPSSFAGGAQPVARGSTLRLGVGALVVMYVTHNWNAVLALQAFVLKLIEPLVKAIRSSKEQKQRALEAAQAEKARLARVNRLKAKSEGGEE